MKKQIVSILSILGLVTLFAPAAGADDLATLSGKWTVQKTNEEGQRYTQQIEIKKDKFTFRIASADDETRLYAEGDVKLEKAGPFKSIVFFNIKGGGSKTELEPVDDTYTSIYTMDDGAWMLVTNFDKEREQKPSLDVYRKVTAPAKKEEK